MWTRLTDWLKRLKINGELKKKRGKKRLSHLSLLKARKSLTRSHLAVREFKCTLTSSFFFIVSLGSFLTCSPSANVSIM